jgi:hypothetical protein
MARSQDKPDLVRISLQTTPVVRNLLELLVEQGIYGRNISEVAERLVAEKLRNFAVTSCFVSYSHSDKVFVRERLYDALRARGVECWFDDHDILPGDDLYEKIEDSIFKQPKVVLCCSRSSLTSWWVENEIDMVLRREKEATQTAGVKQRFLIPLDLDGFVFSNENQNSRSKLLLSRAFADFAGWESDYSKFSREADKLASAILSRR